MNLHWHEVDLYDDAAAAQESLKVFGITVGNPLDRPMHYSWSREANGVLVDVGTIFAFTDGRFLIRPRSDCFGIYLKVLLGSTSQAFRTGRPSRQSGWTYKRSQKFGNYWFSPLLVRAFDGDPIAEIVTAARRQAATDTPDLTSRAIITEAWQIDRSEAIS